MIEDAEREGKLSHAQIVLEPSSGNTGIGLAMVCAAKGYKLAIVMSEGTSIERRKILSAYGAQLVLTPAGDGTDGAIRKAHEILKSEPGKYFMPDQFSNPTNPLAHYRSTADEIIAQTGGKIDAFVAALGTSGTLMGAGARLREKIPGIELIGAEPTLGHKIQGLKNMQESIVPKIYDRSKLDRIITVRDEDSYETARALAKKEGILAGMSSGAALWAAMQKAKEMESGTIVTILPDRGERYMSTSLFP